MLLNHFFAELISKIFGDMHMPLGNYGSLLPA